MEVAQIKSKRVQLLNLQLEILYHVWDLECSKWEDSGVFNMQEIFTVMDIQFCVIRGDVGVVCGVNNIIWSRILEWMWGWSERG